MANGQRHFVRMQKVATLIEVFPEYPGLARHGVITAEAGKRFHMRHLVKEDANTPEKSAAQIMQEYNHDTDTYKTYIKKGRAPESRPNLFKEIQGEGWRLRDAKAIIYPKASVEPFRDMSGSPIADRGPAPGPVIAALATSGVSWEIPAALHAFASRPATPTRTGDGRRTEGHVLGDFGEERVVQDCTCRVCGGLLTRLAKNAKIFDVRCTSCGWCAQVRRRRAMTWKCRQVGFRGQPGSLYAS
jgi:hypothetical protein